MDLQLTKLALIEMILKTKNFSVLEQVKALLNQTSNNAKTSEAKDWWNDLNKEKKLTTCYKKKEIERSNEGTDVSKQLNR